MTDVWPNRDPGTSHHGVQLGATGVEGAAGLTKRDGWVQHDGRVAHQEKHGGWLKQASGGNKVGNHHHNMLDDMEG